MSVGEVLPEPLATGVITEREMSWIAAHLGSFTRHEEAVALRLGRLIDAGQVNLGCRIPARIIRHRQILNEWIEPLGWRRSARYACARVTSGACSERLLSSPIPAGRG